jgi:hypothetical protein
MATDKTHQVVYKSSPLPPGVKLRHLVTASGDTKDNNNQRKRGGLKGIWATIAYPVRLYKAFAIYCKPLEDEYLSQCALIRMVETQQSDKLKYDFLQGQANFTTYEHDVQSEMPWQHDLTNPFPQENKEANPMYDNQRRSEYQRLSKELETRKKAQLKAAWDCLMLESKRLRSVMLDIEYEDENHFRESMNTAVETSRARIISAADVHGEVLGRNHG